MVKRHGTSVKTGNIEVEARFEVPVAPLLPIAEKDFSYRLTISISPPNICVSTCSSNTKGLSKWVVVEDIEFCALYKGMRLRYLK